MIPGEIITPSDPARGGLAANTGLPVQTLSVTNTATGRAGRSHFTSSR